MITLRIAAEADGAALADIYGPFVRDTAISFEQDPPDGAEMARRAASVLMRYPWLVAEREGVMVGYAYAGPHGDRAAYRWSVKTSVYVAPQAWRQGAGRRLYEALIDILRRQGFHCAFAGITLPNAASVALHEACGFEHLGTYAEAGYKFGRWHDVGRWRLALSDAGAPPREPLAFGAMGGAIV